MACTKNKTEYTKHFEEIFKEKKKGEVFEQMCIDNR